MSDSTSSEEWYENYYNKVNVAAADGSLVSNTFHKLLERKFRSNLDFDILEVGANREEHVKFVSNDFRRYVSTDIRESGGEARNRDRRIEFLQANVECLPFDDSSFDRVISTCVFHHVGNPEKGFEEVRRVLKDGGSFSLMLPNDPGLGYRTFRRFTSLRKAQKLGVLKMAKLAHEREHRNHYLSLLAMITWVFRADKISVLNFPFGVKVYDLHLLTVLTIKVKKSSRDN